MFKNLFMAGLAALVVPAFAAEWMTDLDAAKTKAATENKAVLVDFTGSDWCRYCILLKKNVFDTPEFEAYAADKFVLVEIDVPNNAARVGGPEKLAANRALCEQYSVSGFPTILVLSPGNDVLGGFVGGASNLAATTAPLDAALANGKKLQEAEQLQGVEKAKVLMDVYKSLPADLQPAATAMQQKIAALDPENITGIQDIAKEGEVLAQLGQDIKASGRDADKALAAVNAALPKLTGTNKEKVLELKFMILNSKLNRALYTAKTEADVLAAKPIAEEMLNCLPEAHRAQVAAEIEQLFANPAAVLTPARPAKQKQAPRR